MLLDVSNKTAGGSDNPDEYEICRDGCDTSRWDAKIVEFYQYWRKLKSGLPGLPGRQHMDPIDIPHLLSTLWLIDVQKTPLRFRVRLMGTGLVTVLGRDLTGKWLDETHRSAPNLPAVMERFGRSALEGVVTHRPPCKSDFHAKTFIFIENILVPLARDGVNVDMLAGYSSLTGSSGERLSV